MKIDELALEEASAKLLRLRLTDVGGRKERPSETVKSVLKRGLGGMYDDQAVMYILRHGLQYYQSAQQPRALDAALWVCQNCGEASELSSQRCSVCNTPRQ